MLKNVYVYLVSNILNALIPFILLPILTRYLSVEEYGQLALFQLLVTGLGAFIGLSSAGSSSRKYYDNISHSEISRFNGNCFIIMVVSSTITILIAMLFSKQLSDILNIPPLWIVLAIIINISLYIRNLRLGQWQVRKQAKLYGVFQVSNSLFNMLISIFFVVGLELKGEGRVEAQVIVAVVFAVVALALLYKDKLIKINAYNTSYMKEALSYGVPLMPHVFGRFLLLSTDRFFINMKLGVAETGIYMLAMQFSLVMGITFDAINKAYVPWLFEQLKINEAKSKQKLVTNSYIYFLVLLILSALSFYLGPIFIVLIAGEKYRAAGEIIGWLCLGQSFGGMYLVVTGYVFYSKKTGSLSTVTIFSGVFNVLIMFSFVEYFGLVGAAQAFALSKFIQFIATWYLANKVVPMPWFSVNYK